jgi:DNA-binding response OmpR family regulator
MLAILLEEGYLVDLAASGSEAIGKTEESTYNVALLDIKLPDMEA